MGGGGLEVQNYIRIAIKVIYNLCTYYINGQRIISPFLIIDEHISEAYAQRLQSPNSSRERTEEGQTQQQSHCYLKVEEEGHTTPQKTTHPDKTARLRCANRPRHASTGM